MNVQEHVYKTMLSEVHKLLRLYLIVPISYFSNIRKNSLALKHVLTYVQSSMSQKRLNNCVSLHVRTQGITEWN